MEVSRDNEVYVFKHYKEGVFWFSQNKYENAFTHFNLVKPLITHQDTNYNLFLSYYGLSLVYIGHKSEGLKYCTRASNSEFENEKVFYNLACAALACNKRKGAIKAISQGKMYNPDSQLLSDLRIKIGFRRKPYFSILDRNNSINILLGKLTYKKKARKVNRRKTTSSSK